MRILDVGQAQSLLARSALMEPSVEAQVANIVRDVAARGDLAVAELTAKFEQRSAPNGNFELSAAAWDAKVAEVSSDLVAVITLAANRIREFHSAQTVNDPEVTRAGVSLRLRTTALSRVGLYVPGGSAKYPSSVLMTAIPAQVAGVKDIIMVTPSASPECLLAARLAGVTRVFEIGGAQAIAALAFGTATVPKVDKIVGPGNQWVAAAKRQVFGMVDIDSIAGPTEVLILADESADVRVVAAELLAQAEHDTVAQAIAVVCTHAMANALADEVEKQVASLPRKAIAEASLNNKGAIVVTPSLTVAIDFANRYASEHLSLHVENAEQVALRIEHAGAVFVGHASSEAAGDYLAGTNHVLPTGGSARFSSPLGVYDFQKKTAFISYTHEAAAQDADAIAAFAESEGLHAHGRAAQQRKQPFVAYGSTRFVDDAEG